MVVRTLFLRVNRVVLVVGVFCTLLSAQIQLQTTLTPSSLQVNESGRLLISLTNANPNANTTVHNGDVLRLYLPLWDANILSVGGTLTFGGRAFHVGDWVVDTSGGTNPVTLVYQ